MICYQRNNLEQEQERLWVIDKVQTAIQLFRAVLEIKDIEFPTGQEYILYSLYFKVKVFTLTISPACVHVLSSGNIFPFSFLCQSSVPVSRLSPRSVSRFSHDSPVSGPEPGMSCNARDCESRNIWQYLNNNKASLGQPEHEVTFYPSPSLSGQDRLLSFNFRDCVRKERSQLLLSRR